MVSCMQLDLDELTLSCAVLQGMLYSCQDSDGNIFESSYVLAAGQQITKDWCEDATLQVNTSAYHATINVSVPAYTPDRR